MKKLSINYFDFSKWVDNDNLGEIIDEDGMKFIKVKYKEKSNSSISLRLRKFPEGEIVQVSVMFKAKPENNGMLFFGDAVEPDPYDNSDSQVLPGNNEWQKLQVRVKFSHDDIGMIFLYGSRNKGVGGDYVLYKDLEINQMNLKD